MEGGILGERDVNAVDFLLSEREMKKEWRNSIDVMRWREKERKQA